MSDNLSEFDDSRLFLDQCTLSSFTSAYMNIIPILYLVPLNKLTIKSSPLDPVPASVLKQYIPAPGFQASPFQ